ncbi:hypothetical protein NWE59_01025 [Mycoplasmopsis felis]|uniref:hypothetical protein n=1 Tax=Mycoplasmopsis felis TaxID=33923 RepID=UPI0021AF7DE4|nr:hypothetical protein [Mycoplasmopsis felis]UWV78701.1 hypothetical protein NWE59_01025 [Mycoplasmopsis felis]
MKLLKRQINSMENEEAIVKVIAASAGYVNGNDLLLAQASNAIIFVFNLKLLLIWNKMQQHKILV